ncbi:MAG: RtcB family protein [Phycisphaerae bacterium]
MQTEAPVHQFLCGSLPRGVAEVLDRLQNTEGVTHIAVMPDVHLASEFCVGTVVASDRYLFPNAVGGDIGCGMLALQFDGDACALEDPDRAAQLLGALIERCPGRRHHRRMAPVLDSAVREMPLSHDELRKQSGSDACRTQLGTLGAGNHFLELQSDEQNHLWLMLHTGSRHLGQLVHHHHLAKTRKLPTNLLAIGIDSEQGRNYLTDLEYARAWAKQNRKHLALAAARAIEQILHLSPKFDTLLDCDHNHSQLEMHPAGERLIHRKGATAAQKDQPGLIPGSMATTSFHTLGRGNPASLHSSSHGAGRQLSRTQARSQIPRARLREQLRRANVWYAPHLEDSLREESPAAYKPIEEVMRAQAELTTITRRLRPLLIHKGI